VRSDLRAHHAGAEYGYLANDQIAHVVPPGELCGVANGGWRFARDSHGIRSGSLCMAGGSVTRFKHA